MKYQGKITDPKDLVTKEYVDTGLSGKLGTSGDGSNVTAAFTAASSRTNISTGEKLTVIFGKIAKWFTDLGAAAFRGVDSVPTDDSTNLVESGGVKSALDTFVRPNLLDNWYFATGKSGVTSNGYFPINQREQLTYIGVGYGIDRWKSLYADTVISISETGLSISGASINAIKQISASEFWQPLKGKVVTLSILLASGELYSGTVTFPTQTDVAWNTSQISFENGYINVEGTPDSDSCGFRIVTTTSQPTVIRAVKMELGTEQSLAYNEVVGTTLLWIINEIPNFAEELAKCQRYFTRYPSEYYYTGVSRGYEYIIELAVPCCMINRNINVSFTKMWLGLPANPGLVEMTNRITYNRQYRGYQYAMFRYKYTGSILTTYFCPCVINPTHLSLSAEL